MNIKPIQNFNLLLVLVSNIDMIDRSLSYNTQLCGVDPAPIDNIFIKRYIFNFQFLWHVVYLLFIILNK